MTSARVRHITAPGVCSDVVVEMPFEAAARPGPARHDRHHHKLNTATNYPAIPGEATVLRSRPSFTEQAEAGVMQHHAATHPRVDSAVVVAENPSPDTTVRHRQNVRYLRAACTKQRSSRPHRHHIARQGIQQSAEIITCRPLVMRDLLLAMTGSFTQSSRVRSGYFAGEMSRPA